MNMGCTASAKHIPTRNFWSDRKFSSEKAEENKHSPLDPQIETHTTPGSDLIQLLGSATFLPEGFQSNKAIPDVLW